MNGDAPDDAITRCLDDVVAPLVAADGGTLTFVRRRGAVVEVRFGGMCRGGPGQRYTLEGVILPALRVVDASVREVKAVF